MAEIAVSLATSKAEDLLGKLVGSLTSGASRELKLLLGVRVEIRYCNEISPIYNSDWFNFIYNFKFYFH